MDSKSDSRSRLFDAWSGHYDASTSGTDHPFPFGGYAQVLDEIVRQACAFAGMTVLDLGTGNLAARFIDVGCAVWGVDFSAEMVAKASQKAPHAAFAVVDLTGEWPAALMRRFDCVVASYVFHEFDLAKKIQLLLRLTGNHLSCGGKVVIGDISFETIQARDEAHVRWADRWDDDEFYWAADEALAACQRAGLQAVYTQVSQCGGVYRIAPAMSTGKLR